MEYEDEWFDPDAGTIFQPPWVPYTPGEPDTTDFHFSYRAEVEPHAVVIHNQCPAPFLHGLGGDSL